MDIFRKNPEMSDFLKIHPWEPSWSRRAGRQTDNRTDRRTWRSLQSLFAMLWTRLKTEELHNFWLAITICQANRTSKEDHSIFHL